MGDVIPFSEFKDYLSKLRSKPDFVPGTILDTNVLITHAYEIKDPEWEIRNFLDENLRAIGISYFATITTRSEFIDFFRRMLMTEYLRDATSEHSNVKFSKRERAVVQSVSGRMSQRHRRGGDPVFSDSDLKEIKKAFSAEEHSGLIGWIEHCEAALGNGLKKAEEFLTQFDVKYITPNEKPPANYFSTPVEWSEAVKISGTTCLGLSDAMILNALRCSRFSFMVSLDFDLGYAALASKEMKDVVMPDEIASQYRHYHFDPH